MKAQGISTEFYLILFVVCVGLVIFLLLWGMVQRVYRNTAGDTDDTGKEDRQEFRLSALYPGEDIS